MTWTKKHDQFALSCNLSESDKLVLRDLMRKGKLNEPTEVEIDLKKTNSWIGKQRYRGEYHRKTITGTIPKLDEKTMGMVVILKRYSPWVYRVMVRPLSVVEKIQTAKCASSSKGTMPQAMYSEEHKQRLVKQQQQDISKINSLLREVGLNYDPDALVRIWRLAGKKIESVVKAIELMLYRHSSDPIARPHGFIIECLKRGWQENFDLYYQPELPKFENVKAIANFVTDIVRHNRLSIQT